MTVEKLMERLSKYPSDMDVVIPIAEDMTESEPTQHKILCLDVANDEEENECLYLRIHEAGVEMDDTTLSQLGM